MTKDQTKTAVTNILNLDGIVYKTNGNIVFRHSEQSPYVVAQSTLLRSIDGIMENGLQTLLKKLKS